MISSELDEVVAYSSRVVVRCDRQVVAELTGQDLSAVIVQAIAAQAQEGTA